MPHQPFSPTDRPTRALIAWTDPNEQESVVLLRVPPHGDGGRLFHVEHRGRLHVRRPADLLRSRPL